jgi:hypothetical protein
LPRVLRRIVPLLVLLALPGRSATAQEHDHEHMLAEPSAAPKLDLHGFFDVTLRAARLTSGGRDSTALGSALGQFDLFMSSRLSDRISFLGEAVLEADEKGGGGIDLERAYVRYAFSDRLRVTAGRTHSAVSYWYVTCHHGALLQPTIQRPIPVRFEDEVDGGILPAHAVGMELSGRQALGDLSLDWVGNLANGRPADRTLVQTTGDANRDKQLGLSATLSAPGLVEWHAGGALFHDRTPADPATGLAMDQDIASAHLAMRAPWVDEVAEYFSVRDRERDAVPALPATRNHAWYGVVTLGPGTLRPYLAIEGVRIAAPDHFYAGLRDLDRGTLGLRCDVNAFNVVKLEYRNALRAGERTHELLLQTAFTF